VHRLLGLFAELGWSGAPRYLGTDAQGREVLGFLPGHVAWASAQPPEVFAERSLARAAVLVREFHDLTAGTELAGGGQVVCHNDLAPKNTVYQDLGEGLEPVTTDLPRDGDVPRLSNSPRVHSGQHSVAGLEDL
jgi:hypothetical protein